MKAKLLKICKLISPILIGSTLSSVALAIETTKIVGTNEIVVIPQYASTISDPNCENPIDSFNLSSNLMLLSKVGISIRLNGGDYKEGLKVAKTMNWLPTKMEVLLGEKLHEARKNSHSFINPKTKNKRYARLYKKSNQVLRDVLKALPAKLPFPVKLYITTNSGINASAQPGGYIYITKKAAEKDKNFLATIFAHEISHIAKRHTTRQYQSTIIDSVTTFTQFKSLINGSSNSINEITNLATATAKLIGSYTKKQEAQADVCSGHALVRMKGYDVAKGINEFVDASKGRETSTNPFFAEHPSAQDRLKLFQFSLNDKKTSLAWDAKKKKQKQLESNKLSNIQQSADNLQKSNNVRLKEKKTTTSDTSAVTTKKGAGEQIIDTLGNAGATAIKAIGGLFD